jgi:hypothetical protein
VGSSHAARRSASICRSQLSSWFQLTKCGSPLNREHLDRSTSSPSSALGCAWDLTVALESARTETTRTFYVRRRGGDSVDATTVVKI